MTILVVDPGLRLWGSERALLAVLGDIAAANDGAVLLVPTGAELAAAARPLPGVRVVEADFANLHRAGGWRRWVLLATVLRLALQHRCDRIHLNQAGLCRLVHLAARLLGRPLVNHVRLADDVPRAMALPASLRAPVASILVSRDMLHLAQALPRREHHALVMAYDPYVREEPDGVTDDRPADAPLVCVGRLAPLKRQALLIEAIARLHDAGRHVRLDLAGTDTQGGAYQASLEAQAQRRGISHLVRFLGFLVEPGPVLAAARFAPMPSVHEALGRVVMEAWDHGAVPIVFAGSGGAAEIAGAADAAILYPRDDAAALAEAIATALDLPEATRDAMVARGRAWMRRHLSREAFAAAVGPVLFPDRPRSRTPSIGENPCPAA